MPDVPRKLTADEAVTLLREGTGPENPVMSATDLAEASDTSRPTAHARLQELLEEDRVMAAKKGGSTVYWLPPNGEDVNDVGSDKEREGEEAVPDSSDGGSGESQSSEQVITDGGQTPLENIVGTFAGSAFGAAVFLFAAGWLVGKPVAAVGLALVMVFLGALATAINISGLPRRFERAFEARRSTASRSR